MNAQLQQRIISILCICLLFTAPLLADNGTWSLAGNGVWDTAGNWYNSVVADGSGYTAWFTNGITASRVVFPYAAKTIGNIYVNDNDATPTHAWSINDGSNAFTLAVASGSPLLNCITRLNLLPVVYGNQGFTKIGLGVLNLGLTSNLISGNVNLYQGSEILLNHFQALLNADVTVTGTLVNSRKMQLNAKSLTIGQDGNVNLLDTDSGATTVAVAIIVKDSITVNSGGQLGGGLSGALPANGQPFALLAPAITVNANGRIVVKNNMAAVSTAEPAISGSNITVNSDGEIQFAQNSCTYVINNPLTLAGDGSWFDQGALHTAGNGINLTNNSPTTLAGITRIGQYGVGGYMVMNQPISGNAELIWHAQAASGSTHAKVYYLNANNSYTGTTILTAFYASPTFEQNVHQAFPKTPLQVSVPAGDAVLSYYDLNSYTQALASLTVSQKSADTFEVRGDSGAELYVGGAMDYSGGTTLMKVPVKARNQQCQVNGGATMTLTSTINVQPWGQLRPLWSGSGTATANINSGGKVQCYSVRIADVAGTPIVNVNNGGELNFADLYAGNGAPSGGKVNINGGTLSDAAVDYTQTNWIWGFSGKDITVEILAGGATFNIANQYRAVSEVIAGSAGGNLTKTGGQTLALEVAPTLDGNINVQQGELRVNCDLSVLSGSVNVSAGAKIGGSGSLGAMTIPSGATVAAGNSVGVLTFSSLAMGADSTNLWEKDTLTNDIVVVTGNLSFAYPTYVRVEPLGGTPGGPYVTNWVYCVGGTLSGIANIELDLSGTAGWQGNIVQVGNNVGVVLTPEPAFGLMAVVLFGLLRKVR
jgi:autotransporter-associated beta strand protein